MIERPYSKPEILVLDNAADAISSIQVKGSAFVFEGADPRFNIDPCYDLDE